MPAELKPSYSAISPEEFSGLMSFSGVDWSTVTDIAVAVSGGGDSLALALLLVEWGRAVNIHIHALTVDHGLRPESAAEAKYVCKILEPLGCIHHTLLWAGDKPKTGIQEAARDARYRLMAEYCQSKGIAHLCVAHHGNDQMETILFRLAKGTGLDGLVGMRPIQILENGLVLLRPLLSVSHQDLLEACRARKIEWIEDPSNQNNRYARVRIRNIIEVLEGEGLSVDRISSLSSRLSNSVDLISYLVDDKYKNIASIIDTKRIEINYIELLRLPFEGKTRILKQAIIDLHPEKKYPARLEDVERLAARLDGNFRGATLGGCLFRKKKDVLIICNEES